MYITGDDRPTCEPRHSRAVIQLGAQISDSML
jgi:hypothetical protein